MAGDGVRGGEGLQGTSAGATREDGDSSGNLWRCRRDRFLRAGHGIAEVHQRASELLSLGAEGVHRREFDFFALRFGGRAAVVPIRAGGTETRSVLWNGRRALHDSCLQRAEETAGGSMATVQSVELTVLELTARLARDGETRV